METTTNQPNEDVIRKIQKMFAMAQGNHSEAEAELMMARAQELLAKYNLDAAMVQDANVAGGTKASEPEKREKTRMNRSAQYEWQRELWASIADANFCWHSVIHVFAAKRSAGGGEGKTSKKPVKRHLILGKESNVLAVKMMGEYLEDTMEKLLPYPNSERLSRSAISWKGGCAARLGQRVREQAEARLKASEAAKTAGPVSSTALVLRDVVKREYAANYDASYGEGAYARSLVRDADYAAANKLRQQREADALAAETPAQKAARLREEAKQSARNEKHWASQDRKEEAKARMRDHDAYSAGRRTAESIGLNSQVSSTTSRKEIE